MADPKYANLPGIAYDQPDCYETDDLPESDQYLDFEAEEDNVAVERFHLNPDAAAQKFRGKILDGSRVDFSDRISRSRRLGYDARTLWELAPIGEPETTLQKFLRLKCEVQELINDIQTKGLGGAENDDPNLRTQDVLKEVSLMQQALLDLRLDKEETSGEQTALNKKLVAKIDEMKTSQDKPRSKVSQQTGLTGDLIQYELCMQPESNRSSQLARVTELENRLQRLETVMGSEKKDKLASVAFNPKNQSVLGCLTVLNSRLSLLEPSHIELIESRLTSVLQKVTKISEKKLDVQELERTLKLSDLYDLMEESSGTIQALPELAARLSSLKDLHESASEIIKELSSVKSLQEAIAAGTVDNDKTLKELQSILNETIKNAGVKS